MKKTFIRKPISILLSLLMVLSVFGGMAFTASAENKTIAEGVIYKQGDTIVLPGNGVYYVKDSERHPAQTIVSNGTVDQFEGDEYSYMLVIDEWDIYAYLDTFAYWEEMSQGLSVLGITFTGSGTESDPYLPKLAFGEVESTWEGDGEGTEDAPWLINNVDDLRTLSANVASGMTYFGKFLKVTDNIDCGSDSWEPIGGANAKMFMGTFDGDGKTITYSIICSENDTPKGLFAQIGSAGTVKNLNVAGSIVNTAEYAGPAGGIAADNYGLIENCYSAVDITKGCDRGTGGIAAFNEEGATIRYCAASGTLTWTGASGFYACIGGITSEVYESTVTNSTSLCNVLAENAQDSSNYAGIFIGRNVNNYATPECYYLFTAATAGFVNKDSAEPKTPDELKAIGQAAYDAGYTVYGLALGAVASNPDQEAVETLELTQHDSGFNGNCFSVAPGSATDLYDYTSSWGFDGDYSLSEMGVTISALYGEAIRKVVVYSRSHWNSFWNGTPVAVAGGTTLTYTQDGNTFTFENMDASSVIISASAGTGLMITKIDVYYVDTDHDVVKTVRLIDAIGTVAYTTACKQKIDAARNAYDALTDAQKANVSNYETLQLAEGQYAALQLAADMTAFETYKTEKKAAMDALLQEGDSEAVQSIVGLAKTAIDGAQYDESKTLDENKAALDTLVANVPNAVAEQRATDLYAAKIEFDHYKAEQKAAVEAMAQEGDSEAVAQIIAEAAAAIDALIYDEYYTLAENKATVDTLANIADRLAAQRAADAAAAQLAADKAAFEAYKFNLVAAVQAMAQDGDSEASAQIIADAAAAIALLDYDTAKTLDENKAAVDALADIADALAAQRAADKLAADKALFEAFKTEAKEELESMKEEGDSDIVTGMINDAIAVIDAVIYDDEKTLAENNDVLFEALEGIDNLPVEIAAQRAAEALAKAKADAKAELAAYKNAADYRAAEQTALADAITAGNNAIDAAADADAVATALANAKAAIDAIKTNAELTAEEAAAALADAKEQLTGAVNTAKAFYDTIKDVEKYATIADTLDTAIQQGEAMLNSDSAADILAKAEQVLGVLASVKEQKDTIDATPTDEPTNPTEPTEPTEEPTDKPTETSGACELCGKTTHSPRWIGYLHTVIVFVRNLFTKVFVPAAKLAK